MRYVANGNIELNTGPHLPSLLQEQTVYTAAPPSGTMVSDTQYFYDNYNTVPLLQEVRSERLL